MNGRRKCGADLHSVGGTLRTRVSQTSLMVAGQIVSVHQAFEDGVRAAWKFIFNF